MLCYMSRSYIKRSKMIKVILTIEVVEPDMYKMSFQYVINF